MRHWRKQSLKCFICLWIELVIYVRVKNLSCSSYHFLKNALLLLPLFIENLHLIIFSASEAGAGGTTCQCLCPVWIDELRYWIILGMWSSSWHSGKCTKFNFFSSGNKYKCLFMIYKNQCGNEYHMGISFISKVMALEREGMTLISVNTKLLTIWWHPGVPHCAICSGGQSCHFFFTFVKWFQSRLFHCSVE